MKRVIIATFLLILSVLSILLFLSGCGNMSIGMGEYHFAKVHILTHDGSGKCVEISKWYDNSTGIEVCMTDGNHLFLSEGTYILVEDYCPICGKVK